jgi:hypothetical protein
MSPRQNTLIALTTIILLTALVACEKAEPDPTATPDKASIQAASTLFAQPTRAVRATPTATPASDVELDLNRTVARMEQAVLAGDVDGYMAYVWDGDPLFWAEHRLWAQDWQAHPLSVFVIELYGIQSLSADTAAARMTMQWSQQGQTDSGSAGGATVSVIFYRKDDTWLLGGERWKTTDVSGFRFYYFADSIVDNQAQANAVIEFLPAIYADINRKLDFTPEHIAHLKMYESPVTLQNWTRLSIPVMDQWNEPGESIKIPLGAGDTAPLESDVAREYTRFVLYEIAGGSHGRYPWWMEEGVAAYGGSLSQTLSRRNRVIKQIAGRALAPADAPQQLLDWEMLKTRPDLLDDDMQWAINQSYTLVQYITDTYGAETRNAWIRAVATDQTVEEATLAQLGVSLDDLDTAWRAWLQTKL